MNYSAWRDEFPYQATETTPWQSMALTSTQQGMPPSAAYLTEKPRQPIHVSRHRVVVQISCNHPVQPFTHDRNWFVTTPHQRFSNRCQRCTHPFLYRQPDDMEICTVIPTAVREAEEVECFRLSCFPLPALLRSESTKSDQPRFVGVEFQFELGKAHAHCCKKAPCFSFVLKPHDAIVCIAHKDDIASSMSLAPLVCPKVQHIVQINI